MPENKTPFVINDRRKFTSEGELRHDREPSSNEQQIHAEEPDRSADEPSAATAPTARPAHEPIAFPSSAAEPDRSEDEPPKAAAEPIAFPSRADTSGFEETEDDASHLEDSDDEPQLPPAPSAEQTDRASRAYDATVDRLDTAIRATNPGMERAPEMTFERFVQSLYMQAIIQLGGAAEPGQTPQVDLMGARQTIDMLGILSAKTKGNLSDLESKLLESALFEARMGFLEVTQALARQASARQPVAPGAPSGPSIVR